MPGGVAARAGLIALGFYPSFCQPFGMRKSLLTAGTVVVMAGLGAGELRGASVGYDGFNSYTPGSQLESGPDGSPGSGLNGGSGFTSAWNVADAFKSKVTISAQPMSFANG